MPWVAHALTTLMVCYAAMPRARPRLTHMTRLHWILVAAGMATGSACAADNCESLRTEIEAKIAASGATRFTVTTVDAQATAAGQVVGACDLGSKKIIYQREGGFPAPGDSATPQPRARNAPMLTECRDGSVSVGGDCRN